MVQGEIGRRLRGMEGGMIILFRRVTVTLMPMLMLMLIVAVAWAG